MSMTKKLSAIFLAGSALGMGGCASMGPDGYTAVGAMTGAAAGSMVSRNPAMTILGAVAGGLVGNAMQPDCTQRFTSVQTRQTVGNTAGVSTGTQTQVTQCTTQANRVPGDFPTPGVSPQARPRLKVN